MRIVITGAGEVGYHLAKLLANEAKDIYIIDQDEDRLNYVSSHIDVFPIKGDAKSIDVLEEAQVKDCDLLISVTSSEDVNLLVSIMGKKFGAKRTIARVTSSNLTNKGRIDLFKKLGVDDIISPSQEATEEISRLVRHSAFTDEFDFEGGKLIAFGIQICEFSPLVGKSVRESASLNPNRTFKPILLHRNEDTLLITGETIIEENDIVYFVSTKGCIREIIRLAGKEEFVIQDIMIMGGSDIGVLTAKKLENDFNIILIEKNKKRCLEIAKTLRKTLVVNLDGSDVDALKEEGLADMDAFISVTGDSEINIMASLVAKNNGVKKTISRVENYNYIHLSHNIGLDALINKKILAASTIFKYTRKGQIEAIATLQGLDAEIIEFVVRTGSKATKSQIRDLKFPSGANIAGVIRNENGFIPFGDFQLKEGDKVVIFTLIETLAQVEEFFQ